MMETAVGQAEETFHGSGGIERRDGIAGDAVLLLSNRLCQQPSDDISTCCRIVNWSVCMLLQQFCGT